MKEDKTRLSYWFPLIEAAGLPVPKTVILPTLSESQEDGLFNLVGDGIKWDGLKPMADGIAEAAKDFGFPFFLRTDYSSAKHYWKDTCFVEKREGLEDHIHQIAEFSLMADIMGLPIDRWIVREFLPTTPAFYAFRDMPITREFRLFVRDGIIEHIQPYWPEHAIEDHEGFCEDWRERLKFLSELGDDRQAITDLALQASVACPGFWSVDCLHTTRGWFITDMAEGEKSYKYGPSI